MFVFIKIMGFAMVGAALTAWWLMVRGVLAGRIEFTTKGSAGELWYSSVDSPEAFWVVVGIHFLIGAFFAVIAYFVLRKE